MGSIWESGKIINFTERVNFILRMVPITKGLSKKGLLQVREGISITMDAYTRVGFIKIKHQDLALITILSRVTAMKANGIKTSHQDKENKNSQMAPTTKDNLKTESKMARAGMFPIQASMRVNLKMESSMEKVPLLMLTIENIWENGEMGS